MVSRSYESEALGSENAYTLLREIVREGKSSTSELAEYTDSTYSKANTYLTGLKNADFVIKTKEGRTVYYSVKHKGFLDRILKEARTELKESNLDREEKYRESCGIVEENSRKIAGLLKHHIEIHTKLEEDSNVEEMIFNKFQAVTDYLQETEINLEDRTIEAISDTLKLANGIYLTDDYVTELKQKDLQDLELEIGETDEYDE